MGALSPNSERYIALLRLRSERRIFFIMGVAMSLCAAFWMGWCLLEGIHTAAVVPGLYIALAALSLAGL